MADDPNGEAAGIAFLEANRAKPGVVSLPTGLQYKVLVEGAGLKHPTVDSPCECHYAGMLLDGTTFDSSYKRGKPSTFAPNQVIKGWTQAMQLMVVGDKWEMYIPVWKSNLQSDFNVRAIERFGPASSAVLRELNESNQFVQKSAESTSI